MAILLSISFTCSTQKFPFNNYFPLPSQSMGDDFLISSEGGNGLSDNDGAQNFEEQKEKPVFESRKRLKVVENENLQVCKTRTDTWPSSHKQLFRSSNEKNPLN